MKKIVAAICILIISISFFGCKKEVVDGQELVQKSILGNWLLKYNIRTTYADNLIGTPDTLITYKPIDTLVFTVDGQAIKRNKTVISNVSYTIGPEGKTITFNSTPAVTLDITFIRNSSIGFGSQTISQVGGREVKTVIDDQYFRN